MIMMIIKAINFWKGFETPEMQVIRCLPLSINETKCPLAFLVKFTITTDEKYGE